MAQTSRLKWPFPREFEDPWYDSFVTFVEAIDASMYTTREDRSSLLMGGGTVSFTITGVTGDLAWTQPIAVLSPIAGFLLNLDAQGVTLADGEMLYADIVRAPIASQSLPVKKTRQVPNTDDAVLLAIRRGTLVYWRNGKVIGDGDAFALFEQTGTGATPLSSTTPAAITAASGGTAGSATAAARGDHDHPVPVAAPVAVTSTTNAAGSATSLARSDHQHRLAMSVLLGGSLVGARPKLNLVGATVVDNPGSDRVDVTIVPGTAQYICGPAGSGPNGADPPFTNFQTMLNKMVSDGAAVGSFRYGVLLPGTYTGSFTIPQGVFIYGKSSESTWTGLNSGPYITGNLTLDATNQTEIPGYIKNVTVGGELRLGNGTDPADELFWPIEQVWADAVHVRAGNLFARDCYFRYTGGAGSLVVVDAAVGVASLTMDEGTVGYYPTQQSFSVRNGALVDLYDTQVTGSAYAQETSRFRAYGPRGSLVADTVPPVLLGDTAACALGGDLQVALVGAPSDFLVNTDNSVGPQTVLLGKIVYGTKDFPPTAAMKFQVEGSIVVTGSAAPVEPLEQTLTAAGSIRPTTTLARLFAVTTFAATLPPATGRMSGQMIWVVNRSAATAHTLVPAGSDTINGVVGALTLAPNEAVLLAVRHGEFDWQVYARTNAVPQSRTITGASPITVAGDYLSHDLSANRTIGFGVAGQTNGDLLARLGGAWTRLPVGTAGQVLTVSGGLPAWAAAGAATQPLYICGPVGSGPGGSTPQYTSLATMLAAMVTDGAVAGDFRYGIVIKGTYVGPITIPQGVILFAASTEGEWFDFTDGVVINGDVTLDPTDQTTPVGFLKGFIITGTLSLGDGINPADELFWNLERCEADAVLIRAGAIFAKECQFRYSGSALNLVTVDAAVGSASLIMEGGGVGFYPDQENIVARNGAVVSTTDAALAGYAYVKETSTFRVLGNAASMRADGRAPIKLGNTAGCLVDDDVSVILTGAPSTYMVETDGSGGTKTAQIGRVRHGDRTSSPTAAMKFLVQPGIVVTGVSRRDEPLIQTLTTTGVINQATTDARLNSGTPFVATLPPAAGRTAGMRVWVINRSGVSHTLAPTGGDTIQGSGSSLAVAPYDALLLSVKDNETDWQILSRNSASGGSGTLPFYLVGPVASGPGGSSPPYATLTAALTAIGSNDGTIVVMDGTYAESPTITGSQRVVSWARHNGIDTGVHGVTVSGQITINPGAANKRPAVQGIRVRNTGGSGHGIYITGANACDVDLSGTDAFAATDSNGCGVRVDNSDATTRVYANRLWANGSSGLGYFASGAAHVHALNESYLEGVVAAAKATGGAIVGVNAARALTGILWADAGSILCRQGCVQNSGALSPFKLLNAGVISVLDHEVTTSNGTALVVQGAGGGIFLWKDMRVVGNVPRVIDAAGTLLAPYASVPGILQQLMTVSGAVDENADLVYLSSVTAITATLPTPVRRLPKEVTIRSLAAVKCTLASATGTIDLATSRTLAVQAAMTLVADPAGYPAPMWRILSNYDPVCTYVPLLAVLHTTDPMMPAATTEQPGGGTWHPDEHDFSGLRTVRLRVVLGNDDGASAVQAALFSIADSAYVTLLDGTNPYLETTLESGTVGGMVPLVSNDLRTLVANMDLNAVNRLYEIHVRSMVAGVKAIIHKAELVVGLF